MILLAGLLVISSTHFARAESEFGNIHKGNIYTGGTLNYSTYYPSGTSGSISQLQLTTPFEYFIVDHFSLGASIYWNHTFPSGLVANANDYAIGPSATYHFWVQDHWTASLSEIFRINSFSFSSYYFSLNSVLGLNYFLTPSVALGPSVNYRHRFGRNEVISADTLTIGANFLIFL